MHSHIIEVVRREASHISSRPIRLLDVGSGDGRLLSRLANDMKLSGIAGDFFGLEVDDSMVQHPEFLANARERLQSLAPTIDWSVNLAVIGSADAWPYGDGSMDVIVSNQVGEHIRDLGRVFRECARVLDAGGFCVHVFPLEQYVVEGHTGVPFAHRVMSADVREAYIRCFGRLGLSRLGPLRKRQDESAAVFGASRSDYVSRQTSYRRWKDVAREAASAGLLPSYRYTAGPYLLKVLGPESSLTTSYYSKSRPWTDLMLFRLLARVSSVTVFLRTESSFDARQNSLRSDIRRRRGVA